VSIGDNWDHRLLSCLSRRCRKPGCNLVVDVPKDSSAIIDGDKYKSEYGYEQALCDYLVFLLGSALSASAVEMKGGRSPDVSHAVKQIQNGARLIDEIVSESVAVAFFPVLVHAGLPSMEVRILRKPVNKINFRGKDRYIVPHRSGSRLSSIFSSALSAA